MSGNQALAEAVVERLHEAGVRTFCMCPGGRNAPLVEALEPLPRGTTEVLSFFDERSAAFFAFGRARRDLRPVAVVTTSGTAAAELLPAMVEAYYSGVPLVAVTADRPRSYRRSGAPQTIEQAGLFGTYSTLSIDVDDAADICRFPALSGPAHLNVCFEEPLLAGWQLDEGAEDDPVRREAPVPLGHAAATASSDRWRAARDFLEVARRPLVIVGGLQDAADSRDALRFCESLDAPVAAEASSGLRTSLGSRLLRAGDASIQRGFATGAFDSVIRVGDVPSFRVWRDLDLSLPQPVLSVSRKPWRGLTRGVHVQVPPGEPLLPPEWPPRPALGPGAAPACEALAEWDRARFEATAQLLARHPGSEPALFRRLSETIPPGSFVYLGNSLPIREWNQFATFEDRGFAFGENRGANGIDGQLSTFFGWAAPNVENWAVIGDLTALYDLSSAWALRHLDGLRLRLVIVNNGGGRIFQRMFRNERFQNRHATGFASWAAMWGIEHHEGLPVGPLGPVAVIELRPDEAETDAVWAGLADEARR